MKKTAKAKSKKTSGPKKSPVKVFDPKQPLSDPQRELFCELYTSNTTRQFFGNAQNCYAEAYNFQDRLDDLNVRIIQAGKSQSADDEDEVTEDYLESIKELRAQKNKIQNTCKTNGWRLLTKADVRKRCAYLLDQFFKHEVMDRELAWAAVQRFDVRSKVAAIESYNKLHRRFEDPNDAQGKGKVVVELSWKDPEPRPSVTAEIKSKK